MGKEAYDDWNTYQRDIEVKIVKSRPILNNMTLSEATESKKSKVKI